MSDSLQPHGLYVAHQAPLSVEFSRQESWSGLPFPSPGDLPDPAIKPMSPGWRGDSLSLSHLGSPKAKGMKGFKVQILAQMVQTDLNFKE